MNLKYGPMGPYGPDLARMTSEYEFSIGGRKTEGSLEKLATSKLRLDPTNVRFKHTMKEMSESEIEKYIWEEEDAKTLYKQIRLNGGLIQPPVVVLAGDYYLVKDGNRRVVCLRRLSKESHEGKLAKDGLSYSKDHFDTTPCIVLPPTLSQKEMDSLIGTMHVSGPKEWATLNRAWYIYEMYNRDSMDYDEIRQVLGFGKGTVIRMVKAFEKTMEYGKKHPNDRAWFRKFTYFDELYKKPVLRHWIEQEPNNLEKFTGWVGDGKFADVRDVRILPQILDEEEALKALENPKGNISTARELLSQKDPTMTSETFATIKRTIQTLRSIPRSEFIQTAKDPSRMKLLKDLQQEVEGLLSDMDKIRAVD